MSKDCLDPKSIGPLLSEDGIKYTPIKLLGSGTFGCTYSAKRFKQEPSGEVDLGDVALKLINIEKMRSMGTDLEALEEEVRNIQRLSTYPGCSQYVACYYDSFGAFINKVEYVLIVMELVKGVSLGNFLDKHQSLSTEDKLILSIELLKGLYYIHSKGIAHQDIKMDNIMIEESTKKPKYIDFGLSCYRENIEDPVKCPKLAGTFYYYPPEMMVWNLNSKRTFYLRTMHDVWSLGTTLYLMWNNRYPFDGFGNPDTYALEVLQTKYIPSTSKALVINDILNRMMLVGGVKTLKVQDIVKNPPVDVSFLFREPYRRSIETIYKYIESQSTNLCIIDGRTFERVDLIALLKKFNISHTFNESKESLCQKAKSLTESCVINKKELNREEIVILSKLLGVEYVNKSNSDICRELKERVSLVQLNLRSRVLNLLQIGIENAAIAKTESRDAEKVSLLNSIAVAISTILSVNENILDVGGLLCKYREVRNEYIKLADTKDAYKTEVKRNEANIIASILSGLPTGMLNISTENLTIPYGTKLQY